MLTDLGPLDEDCPDTGETAALLVETEADEGAMRVKRHPSKGKDQQSSVPKESVQKPVKYSNAKIETEESLAVQTQTNMEHFREIQGNFEVCCRFDSNARLKRLIS